MHNPTSENEPRIPADQRVLTPIQARRLRSVLATASLDPQERLLALALADGMTVRDVEMALWMTVRRLSELHQSLLRRIELDATRKARRRNTPKESASNAR